VATPASCLPVVAAMAPELMTEPLRECEAGTLAAAALDRVLELQHDVIACGPGLGRTPEVGEFVRGLIARSTAPLVLDADALTVLAGEAARLSGGGERTIVITPHPGEMARLVGLSVDAVQQNRLDVAADFAMSHGVYVVLKGHRTVMATPEGKTFINPTGNPGMATGGTGDILTGMIAAWLAQLLDAEAACRLGVFLHGLAGDAAESQDGQIAMVASDVLGQIGPALARLTGVERSSSNT
jgi:NAD(P)H-hydrate epimerase